MPTTTTNLGLTIYDVVDDANVEVRTYFTSMASNLQTIDDVFGQLASVVADAETTLDTIIGNETDGES